MPTQTDEVNDIGLNWGDLDNTTDRPVHLISVEFAPVPVGLHTLNVLAYSWADTYNTGVITQVGILSRECPHEYKPHPLSVVTIRPHANASWLVVIAFAISTPGVYHLNQVRINYTSQGQTYWQDQNVNTTVTVTNPPLPGPTPLPASAVCYNPKTSP